MDNVIWKLLMYNDEFEMNKKWGKIMFDEHNKGENIQGICEWEKQFFGDETDDDNDIIKGKKLKKSRDNNDGNDGKCE